MARTGRRSSGISLAKGPVGVVAVLLAAYGVTALIFGGRSFAAHPINGQVPASTWLGIATNGWTCLAFVVAGVLLLIAAPLHWGAKTVALIIGLVLGALCVIALVNGTQALGIFAANMWTKLVWGIAAAVLLVVALLPRVGGRRRHDEHVATAEGEAVSPDGRAGRDSRAAASTRARSTADSGGAQASDRPDRPDRPADQDHVRDTQVVDADGHVPEHMRPVARSERTDGER